MADPPPLDVAGIVRQAEARAAEGRAAGRYGEDPALVPLPAEAAWERLAALAVVRGTRPPGVHRRAVVRLAAPFVDDLVEQANRFNAAVVEAVRTLEAELAAERARGDRLEAELERLRGGGG
jgi:hypothetical protein